MTVSWLPSASLWELTLLLISNVVVPDLTESAVGHTLQLVVHLLGDGEGGEPDRSHRVHWERHPSPHCLLCCREKSGSVWPGINIVFVVF